MQHFIRGENVGLVIPKINKEDNCFFIANKIIAHKLCSAYDSNSIFPLYLYPETTAQKNLHAEEERTPNLNMDIVKSIAKKLKLPFAADKSLRVYGSPDKPTAGWDEEDLEMDLETLKSKNKLIPAAEKIVAKQNEVKQRERQIEIEKEVERQKQEKEEYENNMRQQAQLIQSQFESKSWDKKIKTEIANEYFTGITINKINSLLVNPETAADMAMVVSRIFKSDAKGNVSLNLDSFTDLVKGKEGNRIKKEWTEKSNKVRFGTAKKSQDIQEDMGNFDYDGGF